MQLAMDAPFTQAQTQVDITNIFIILMHGDRSL